ncbi:MAG: spore coat protein CotJB [Oscillospiraceae bacterium]|nr:spore coat protein CotJB [Oscillospiraceae bacterium]
MDQNTPEIKGGDGRLPANAPLANPYVPFQLDNPPKYEKNKAFVRGTLFPGLDLPFMGQINKNDMPVTPLTELQMVSFAIQELALYLDTHRDDKEALMLYQEYQKLYDEGVKKYEKLCGPLNHLMPTKGSYAWLDDPWPWEYARNREV